MSLKEDKEGLPCDPTGRSQHAQQKMYHLKHVIKLDAAFRNSLSTFH